MQRDRSSAKGVRGISLVRQMKFKPHRRPGEKRKLVKRKLVDGISKFSIFDRPAVASISKFFPPGRVLLSGAHLLKLEKCNHVFSSSSGRVKSCSKYVYVRGNIDN